MGWHGQLSLHYRHDGTRTTALDRHDGPLRVLQRLYPEGPGICHHVLVHPPGGIVGGDTLAVELRLDAGAHALVTTPGATRFYRSDGAAARQTVQARLAAGARLEWLPLETIAYPGCMAENRLRFDLAPGAEMIGGDLLALGLPAAGQAFTHGHVLQHLELPGTWLERGRVDGADARLLDSRLGWAGQRALGTLWFGTGEALATDRRDALLAAARDMIAADTPPLAAGATSPDGRVVVLRVLAAQAEPAWRLMQRVRDRWRTAAWGLAASRPRIWQT